MTDYFFIRQLGEVTERNIRYTGIPVADALRDWSIREFPAVSLDRRYLYAVVTQTGRTMTYSVARDGEVVRGFVGH